jgi:hypothetical protein
VDRFEGSKIRAEACRRNGDRFARPRFRDALRDFIDRAAADVRAGRSGRKHAGSPS